VSGGFTGNVLLKFYESIAAFVVGLLQRPTRRFRRGGRVGQIVRVLDYAEYGGAPLLGVQGVSIICHGGSPPRAIKNAIRVAVQSVESGMVEDMAAALDDPGGR